MKHLFLLTILFLGHMIHTSAMAAPTAVYAAPADTAQAVKIAKKADKLMKKGQTTEAWDLYEEAGKMGLMSAQRKLMNHYAEQGLMNNAYYWNEKLAKAGDVQAQVDMGTAYLYGPEQTGQTMFAADVNQASEWFTKAYKQGSKPAAYFLGLIAIYQSSSILAERYLRESASEIPYAYYILGDMYYEGTGLKADHAKAFVYYQNAADRDVEEAYNKVSHLYMKGDGCPRDYAKSIAWAEKGMMSQNADIRVKAQQLREQAQKDQASELAAKRRNTRQGAPLGNPAGEFSGLRQSAAETSNQYQPVGGHIVTNLASNTAVTTIDFRDTAQTGPDGSKSIPVIDEEPQFPGGEAALLRFIAEHIRYPQSAVNDEIQGVVYLRFVVNEDGSVGDVVVDKGLQKDCDEEAIRVVKSFPRFKPAKQEGKPVKCWFSLPIRYTLS